MREQVAQFGPERGLVGVVTLPDTPAANAPRVILLSTGVLHRVGSNRLSVGIARALASIGVTTLRFDLSGIGDSERRRDVLTVRESVEADIADAVAYMSASQGEGPVVLMGLCSGAFDAFRAALSQPRVVGAYMIDMPGPFRTWRHTVAHIVARLFRPESWKNPFRKMIGHSKRLVSDAIGTRGNGSFYGAGTRGASSREKMRDELDALLERDVQLCFVFTAGLPDNYNHRSQFRTTFPRAARHPSLSWDFFPEGDHAFSSRESRERLIGSIVAWMQRVTARAASGAAAGG